MLIPFAVDLQPIHDSNLLFIATISQSARPTVSEIQQLTCQESRCFYAPPVSTGI